MPGRACVFCSVVEALQNSMYCIQDTTSMSQLSCFAFHIFSNCCDTMCVCSWDDHDIFDGWGSYPDYLQKSAVFQVGMKLLARQLLALVA